MSVTDLSYGGYEIKLDAQTGHEINTEAAQFTYPELTLSTHDEPLVAATAKSRHVLIVGAGVSGLLVAWMLLDKGHRVTIIADDWAWTNDFVKSRMTSQIAGALWEFPPGGCGLTEIEGAGLGWATIEHYQEWALQSYEFYRKFDNISTHHRATGHSFGLKFADLHQFFYTSVDADHVVSSEDGDAASEPVVRSAESLKLKAIMDAASRGRMDPSTIPIYNRDELKNRFGGLIQTTFQKESLESGYSHNAPIINTDKAMAYLMALVMAKGASMETRRIEKSIREDGKQLLRDYSADSIVNASGLGARELVPDKDVYPVRGAVQRVENTSRGRFRYLDDAYLVPAQRGVASNQPTKTVFLVPRNDDVLYVGSIIQPRNGDKNLTPESPEVRLMWDRAGEFMPSLRHAGLFPGYPFAQGLRPFTKRNVKVRADEETAFPLVHNYGHGGSGWTLGIGTARCAVLILERLWCDERAGRINRELYGMASYD